jgi:hypothetical protein
VLIILWRVYYLLCGLIPYFQDGQSPRCDNSLIWFENATFWSHKMQILGQF